MLQAPTPIPYTLPGTTRDTSSVSVAPSLYWCDSYCHSCQCQKITTIEQFTIELFAIEQTRNC